MFRLCMLDGGDPNGWNSLVSRPQLANLMKIDLPMFVKIANQWNVKYAHGTPATLNIDKSTYKNYIPWIKYYTAPQEEKKREQEIEIYNVNRLKDYDN